MPNFEQKNKETELKTFEGADDVPIPVGTRVKFQVENQDSYQGLLEGVLVFEKGEFGIKTSDGDILSLKGPGLHVYPGTVRVLEPRKS